MGAIVGSLAVADTGLRAPERLAAGRLGRRSRTRAVRTRAVRARWSRARSRFRTAERSCVPVAWVATGSYAWVGSSSVSAGP